jgi:hypothetical protein
MTKSLSEREGLNLRPQRPEAVCSTLCAESIMSVLIIAAKVACVLLSSSHSSYDERAFGATSEIVLGGEEDETMVANCSPNDYINEGIYGE